MLIKTLDAETLLDCLRDSLREKVDHLGSRCIRGDGQTGWTAVEHNMKEYRVTISIEETTRATKTIAQRLLGRDPGANRWRLLDRLATQKEERDQGNNIVWTMRDRSEVVFLNGYWHLYRSRM